VLTACLVLTTATPATASAQVTEREIVQKDPPLHVHVIEAPPGTPAEAMLSNGVVAGVARPSVFARGAAGAVNGAYFVGSGPDAGDVVGAHVSGGELASEPVDGRSTLILSADPLARPRVASLSFRGSVNVGGRSRLLDGVDRVRGLIWGCGGHGGDQPTQRPVHGIFCTDASELVQFTPRWGARTPPARSGVEVTVRGDTLGRVHAGGGTPIPADGFVLSGSGDAARFLTRGVRGDQVNVTTSLRTPGGAPLLIADLAGVVSGGPRLVDHGRIAMRTRAEGFERPGLYGRFVAARNPRTLAGVTDTGALLLVTVDGRRPGYSVGVSLPEAARLMKSLGARDALNLDGGGSTTMVFGGRVVNRPSDRVGERPVGDGVVLSQEP
jgi:hypothetical protein